MEQSKAYEGWAIIELMGHSQIAGYISEETMYGSPLARVDVPAVNGVKEFTKYIGGGAIYAVTPTDEATARAAAGHFRMRPISVWTLPIRLTALPEDNHPGRVVHTEGEEVDAEFGDEDSPI